MSFLGNSLTSFQIYSSAERLRFDKRIQAFEFKPSLGIVAKSIDRFGLDIRSMREPLKRSVQQVMIPSIRQNFQVGGRPSWEPLAFDTVRHRGSAWPILVRTGRLRRGVTTLKIWTITQTAATIKDLPERIWYGKVHQAGIAGNAFSGGNWFRPYQQKAKELLGRDASAKEVNDLAYKLFDKRLVGHGGAPRGSSGIPARPFVMFQDEDIDAIQEVFAEWLMERARRAGVFSG